MEKAHAHISLFIGHIKSGTATETLIGLVADTTGMLAACRSLLEALEEGDGEYQAWLQQECTRAGIEPSLVLNELRTIVDLFGLGDNGSDPYETLGLSRGASEDEIKRAYRSLSLKYHPDTSSEGRGSEKAFIRINRAYQQLTDKSNGSSTSKLSEPSTQWRKEKKRKLSDSQRNRGVVITMSLVIILLVVSVIAAMNFRKRTMLSSLEQSRGAFVPPVESKVKGDLKSPYRSSHQEVNDQSQLIGTKSADRDERDQRGYVSNTNQVARADDTAKEDISVPITTNEPQEIEAPEVPHQPRRSTEAVSERADLSPPDEAVVGGSGESDLTNNINLSEEQPQDLTRVEKKENDAAQSGKQKIPILEPKFVRKEVQYHKKNIPAASPKLSRTVPVAKIDSKPAAKVQVLKQVTAPIEPTISTPKPGSKNDSAALVPQAVIDPHSDQKQQERVESSLEVPPAPVEQSPPVLDTQARVQSFIEKYVKAYEKLEIIQFAQLFMPDAVENGKPFVQRISVYSKWFEKMESTLFDIQIVHADEIDELILVDGRFTLKSVLKNGKRLEQGGYISFELREQESRLLVKKLSYNYEQQTASKKHTAIVVSKATVESLSEQEQSKQVDSSSKGPPAPIAGSSLIDPDLLARVQSFVEQYTAAYEQGNVIQFSQFFMPEAVENGKPFGKRLSVYNKQFEKTESALLDIHIVHADQIDELILLDGRFTLKRVLKNGKRIEQGGNISFKLREQESRLLVKSLSYIYE